MVENFGRYQLVERIALGGFAEIFKAHAVGIAGFEKTLAIKRLHPRYSQDSDFIAWMVDEAKITSQLAHSNICQVLDFAKVDGHYFMAMEYISGRDVYRIMKKLRETSEPCPIELVAFVGREACAGLDYTHRKRDVDGNALDIVHRDMSPQNVMVSLDGDVKLIDFGIAKSRARGYETEAGIIKGKFFYMSPEQARGEELDGRTDVFSLGIVLWELVTGELLYKDDDEVTLLSQVRRAVIEPPQTIRPDVPDALNRIIVKALHKDLNERYQSAFEMQKDLERFLIRYNSKYGKAQVGYWMRSTFYDELPAKEVQNLDSFKHRADFIAEERSLIGHVLAGEDQTRPQLKEDSDLIELGSDLIESVDSSSSVVVSAGVGTGGEFFDDAVTAAVDSMEVSSPNVIRQDTGPSIRSEVLDQRRSFAEPARPESVVHSASSVQISNKSATPAPWVQNASFEHSPTEVGDPLPQRSPYETGQQNERRARVEPRSRGFASQSQQTLSPLMNSVKTKFGSGVRQERVYMILILLVICAGSLALTTHLKEGSRGGGVGVVGREAGKTDASATCKEYVLRDGKKICAQNASDQGPAVLEIRTNPSGATVYLNENRHPGKTPTTVNLDGDKRIRLTLSLANYQTVNEVVVGPADGERLLIERTLEKPLGTLVVTSNPAGASITLDREYKGRTPDTLTNLRLDRTQVLSIEKEGYVSQTRTITWDQTGKSIERNLQFDLVRKKTVVPPRRPRPVAKRRPSRPTRQPRVEERRPSRRDPPREPEIRRRNGKLRVQTRPWSTVFLDGRKLGDAPTQESVPEGNYRLKVCFEGDPSRCSVRRIRIVGDRETTERFRE